MLEPSRFARTTGRRLHFEPGTRPAGTIRRVGPLRDDPLKPGVLDQGVELCAVGLDMREIEWRRLLGTRVEISYQPSSNTRDQV